VSATPRTELQRTLGFWTAAAVVVGTVIGSGIFLVPSDMARAVGSPSLVFAAWIVGGVLSLFGALTYAELAAAMPRAGGEYVYLKEAYGPLLGFVQGWMNTMVGFSASIAAKAAALYTYFAIFFPGFRHVFYTLDVPIGPNGGPLELQYGQLFGVAIVVLLTVLNAIGVRVGGGVQVATTALKIALIAGIIVVGLSSSRGDFGNLDTSMAAAPGGAAGFFAALVAALWAYDGWSNAAMLGADVHQPGRNLPRVLILGTGAVIVVYLLTNLAYFAVLTVSEAGANQTVAAAMMQRAVGPAGGAIVAVAAIVSIFASLNGSLLSGSRVPYAMARGGLFFEAMGHIHPRFGTPAASLALLCVWSSILLLSGRFDQLYRMVIFTSWIFYALTAAGAIVLRYKRPDLVRPYRIWGYPWVPGLFVIVAIALLYSTLVTYPGDSLRGLILIAIALPFYFYWRRPARRAAGSES
jgi:APA family basic amino acid/polyamine antiporter